MHGSRPKVLFSVCHQKWPYTGFSCFDTTLSIMAKSNISCGISGIEIAKLSTSTHHKILKDRFWFYLESLL